MEVLISFVAAIVGENGRSCFATVNSTVMSTLQFNLNDWENEMNDLLDLKNYIEHQLDAVDLDGRSPATEVKKWLREVEKFMIKATSVLQGLTATNQRHFGRLVRFRLRWKAARMLKKMEGLLQAGSFPAGLVSKNYLTRVVEHVPGPSIEDQMTASRTLAELLEKLDDQRIHRIGIWGMGGVGKTTLVKNLNNKLNSSSLRHPFSCVIWATVSKDLDEKRIQIQIAERLNLEVKMEESIQRTARRLYQRLKKEERFLLILDDVWGKIDLDCLGVPQPEIHNGSKILLTSRFSEVCREMLTDIDVKLNVLSKEEAWELFSEK